MKILLACTLLLTSAPALAQEMAHNPRQISDALKAGCTVQQTPQLAGKVHSAPAIIRCKSDSQARATADARPAR